MVKSPDEAMGSPSSTANCAPGGRKGGAGPNLTWSDVKAFCARDGCAATSAAKVRATANNDGFMEPSRESRHNKTVSAFTARGCGRWDRLAVFEIRNRCYTED